MARKNKSKPLTETFLRRMGVPRVLREELLDIDKLDLPPPLPTEKLVETAMRACEGTLERKKPKQP